MRNPTTPGVSVEEITRLPNSVSLIDTAIPIFIGYTELIPDEHTEPLNIRSLLEYEKYFGKPKAEHIQLRDTQDKGVELIVPEAQFLMYYSLQMYFANGGGPCQVVSVGNYTSDEVKLTDLNRGVGMIEDSYNSKLIIFPDAVSLIEPDFYTIYNQTIDKRESGKRNWFVIVDTYYGNSATQSNNLNTIGNLRKEVKLTTYAAAYFPHLTTVLNYTFDETETPINHTGLQKQGQSSASFYADEIAALDELKSLASHEISSESADTFVLADLLGQAIAIAEEVNETADETSTETSNPKGNLIHAIEEAKAVLEAIYDGTIDDLVMSDNSDADAPVFSGEFEVLKTAILALKDEVGSANGITLKNLELSNSALYNQIKKEIMSLKVVLPPSSAMAGVYGRVDSTRGVWKAPANVSLNYVITPTEKISEQEQSNLNIDVSGKSINAIRTFTGKGTLVWGARTLDGKDKENGDDNEWKYVHVRRYCDMIEQSINVALRNFIDEPNIPSTYLRARTMLENFLNQQWIDGALAGSTPKEAYKVEVDGTKDQSTGNNILNVKIEIALVRPAEFIVLNFSHKLQQS